MNKTKVLGAAGVFVLLIASMSFTASQGVRYNTPADTLVYARSGDTRLLDPAEAYDTASSLVIGNVYETLVEDDFENGEFVGVKPLLATSWTISNDGLVYTFNLRKGVKFHDGTDFNASAVKYTLDRLVAMNLGPANPLIGHVYECTIVLDEYTVAIRLEHPFLPFLTCMAHTAACIVSPTAVEAHGGYEKGKPSEWMRKNMVGTGPYVFDHWTEDEETLLVRNGNYWGEKPKMQKILIKQISEKTNLLNLIKNRDVDIVHPNNLLVEHAVALMNEEGRNGIVVDVIPSYTMAHIEINCQKKPLDDVRVRKALAYAVNYRVVVNNLMAGQAYELHTMIPKGIFGHDPDIQGYEFNLAKAEKLLDDAGYPKGKDGTRGMTWTYIYNEDNDLRARVGVMLQQTLKTLGIGLEIQPLKWGTALEYYIKGDFYVNCLGWLPDYPYGDNYLYPLVHSDNWGEGCNYGRYKNERVDELIDKVMSTADEQKALEYYKEIQEILEEEVPYITLYQYKMLTPRGAWVHGYEYIPSGLGEVDFASLYKD